MNSNNSAIPNPSATSYISHESSISQLSGDLFHIQLWLGDKTEGQNDCLSVDGGIALVIGLAKVRGLS